MSVPVCKRSCKKPRILLVTPPFVQVNAPYAATPALTGFLTQLGAEVFQRDFSIETVLDVLLACGDSFTPDVIAFLQGRTPDEAEVLAEPGYLPEGPSFAALADEPCDPDPRVRAKLRCSLYLDDLAHDIQSSYDADFGFSRYAEHLAVAVPDFAAILRRLRHKGLVEKFLERRVVDAIATLQPDIVGVTCPFPGTLLGAFRIAKIVRRIAPDAKLVLGGGYVSTELRRMDDTRVKRFFDVVMFDEGYRPWAAFLDAWHGRKVQARTIPPFVCPSYRTLDLTPYFDMVETTNPMHRLWSEGRWLKVQLARGCYWHKCAFCDVHLDYVKCFEMPSPVQVVDALQTLARESLSMRVNKTDLPGFHFTDEAMPPALIRGLATEILKRGFRCRWWGNVRFDGAFTPALARLMAKAGCCAVTGGLECAHDRLLKLMNKGITLVSAKQALGNFAQAGILTHAYLMYGFPTQTFPETLQALTYVRDRFREGSLHSAYFHRFALTVHSSIATQPEAFGIQLTSWARKAVQGILPGPAGRHFACNEIPFREAGAPDWNRMGSVLKRVLYNYNLGLGLGHSARWWFRDAREGQ